MCCIHVPTVPRDDASHTEKLAAINSLIMTVRKNRSAEFSLSVTIVAIHEGVRDWGANTWCSSVCL